jgi:prevent-host-death family protein
VKIRKRRSTQISVSAAKGQLTQLVRRAETGEDVVLTRHGHAAVRLVPVRGALDSRARRALLQGARKSGRIKATAGPTAARSQDFLYGRSGMPE